ncbi:hypothetical protein O3G_MSEX004512 [Manduca sexta]|uniref:Uncharacterized protein n=1 Tax=Manduca sexta TaxID=7130 RepID=A0A921YWG0_MANSE|nr:hypothetical protein O3G_MSEX004512 [Manduca sexta]
MDSYRLLFHNICTCSNNSGKRKVSEDKSGRTVIKRKGPSVWWTPSASHSSAINLARRASKARCHSSKSIRTHQRYSTVYSVRDIASALRYPSCSSSTTTTVMYSKVSVPQTYDTFKYQFNSMPILSR